MAAGTTAQVLGDIGERHLECSICTNRFREPKMLDCFHSFCLQCLQELSKAQDPRNTKLKCPVCRRETILKENGVADLPNNSTLSALVEEFAVQEQLSKGQGSDIMCQGCEDSNQASSFCMDCAHFLCQECKRAHERVKLTKSHKIYTLAQLRSQEVKYKSALRDVPKCQKHGDQNLSIYCNTCEKLICTTCSVLDHKNHSCSDLSEALDECKQKVAELITKVEEAKAALSTAQNNTEKARKKLDTMFSETTRKIVTKANKEVDKIRQRELKLMQKAGQIYKDRVKTLEAAQVTNSNGITQAENTLDEVKHLMGHGSCCEILDLKQTLFKNLREMKFQDPEEVPDKLPFMDFKDGYEGSLGSLVLKDEWILMTKIRSCESVQKESRYNHDIAAFSNKDIVTVDRKHKQVSYFLPTNDPKVPFISQELQTSNITNPTHVAVNKADQLIVLDGDAVKTLSREYQLLSQFIPGEKSNSKPTCLAVDDKNLIGVGYKDKEEISLHKPDGTLIRRLPAPQITNHLTINKKRFIYIDKMISKVRSLDYNGGTLFLANIEGKNLKGSVSMCCDSDGNMYVNITQPRNLASLVNVHQGMCEVQQFSPDGKYIRTIIKRKVYSHGITFTSGGDLAVAAEHSVKIYSHV